MLPAAGSTLKERVQWAAEQTAFTGRPGTGIDVAVSVTRSKRGFDSLWEDVFKRLRARTDLDDFNRCRVTREMESLKSVLYVRWAERRRNRALLVQRRRMSVRLAPSPA